MLRGSGVNWDLRRDGEPIYTEMYDGYTWQVIAETDGRYPQDHPYPPVPREAVLGDSWHRYYVRMLETVQSMDLIRQAMEKYAKAAGRSGQADRASQEAAQGHSLSRDRGPRRARWASMLIGDGSAVPWRVRVRSSSFCNLSVTSELCRGVLIADIPAVRGIVGYCVGGD